MTRIILALCFVSTFALGIKSQNSITPVSGQNLRIYAQVHATIGKFTITHNPGSYSGANLWAFRPSLGVMVGAEYTLKNARWIPAVSVGYQIHETRENGFAPWDIIQGGIQAKLGINRQIGRKFQLGLYAWYLSVQRQNTRNRFTPLDFTNYEKNWNGISLLGNYQLAEKISVVCSFSYGGKIREFDSYTASGVLQSTTHYNPVWINLGGRFYLYQ